MPRIRRWHPVSHDFNRDPEVQELRRRFGDWAGFMWLELLSVADKNMGLVKGEPEIIARSMAFVCVTPAQDVLDSCPKSARRLSKWSPIRARKVLDWMVERSWLVPVTCGFLVSKYAEYHRQREHKSSRDGIKEAPPLPTEPTEPTRPRDPPLKVPPRGPSGFDIFWAEYPKHVGTEKARAAWARAVKSASPDTILVGLRRTMAYITREQGKYVPLAATWLNQGRWKDDPPDFEPADEPTPSYHRRIKEEAG